MQPLQHKEVAIEPLQKHREGLTPPRLLAKRQRVFGLHRGSGLLTTMFVVLLLLLPSFNPPRKLVVF